MTQEAYAQQPPGNDDNDDDFNERDVYYNELSFALNRTYRYSRYSKDLFTNLPNRIKLDN